MKTKQILIAALLAGAFAPALAWQTAVGADLAVMELAEAEADDSPAGPGPTGREIVREHVVLKGPGGAMMEHFGPGMHGARARAVKNAPYSAEAVNEYQQTLADGNQITTRRSSMSYRDSAGRTRLEVRDDSGAVRNITITDPGEGVTYVLRPDAKTAMKIGPHREMARIAGDKARAEIEAMRGEAGERVIVKRIERDAKRIEREAEREARQGLRADMKADMAPLREEIRIRVAKDMAGHAHGPAMAMHGIDRIGPALAGAFGDIKWSTKSSVKDLGSKEIEGIKVQGKMRSYEIPAGEIGNRNPIVVSTESWYSPELQVTLLTRHSDPRSGERTYRLSNVKRGEPAASLFAVPSDYTVKDTMADIRKSIESKKEAAK